MKGVYNINDFKYAVKLVSDFTRDADAINHILEDRGVTDIPRFLNPTIKECHDPFLLKNMDKAVKIMRQIASGRIKNIVLKVDPDVDGYSSAALMYILISFINPELYVEILLSQGKNHGCPDLKAEVFKDADLLILPDAGSDSESVEMYNALENPSMKILVLDHHPIQNPFDIPDFVTIVNCQDGQYPNTTLTGVGVVRKLYEACIASKVKTAEGFESIYPYACELTALGQIADVSDLKNLESRYYALEGLQYMTQGVKELRQDEKAERLPCGWPISLMAEGIKGNEYFIKGDPTIMNVAWKIAPPLNATIRCGEDKEKMDLFRALAGDRCKVGYKPRRKHKNDPPPEFIEETRQKNVWRKCRNLKSTQDKQVRDALTKYRAVPTEEELRSNSAVLFLRDSEDKPDTTLNGLIANKLASEFKRPVMFLKKTPNGEISGSCRGYEKCGIPSFRSLIESVGVCQVIGHDNAFGLRITEESIPALMEGINKAAPVDTLQTSYVVDYEIDAANLTPHMVKNMAQYAPLWGNHVDEPLFCITNIRIKPEDVKQYNDGMIVGFTYNKVYYSRTIYNRMERAEAYPAFIHEGAVTEGTTLTVRVIGKFAMNLKDNSLFPFVDVLDWYSEPAHNVVAADLFDIPW